MASQQNFLKFLDTEQNLPYNKNCACKSAETRGGVSEWFKELVLKTSESERVRGFESYLLRYLGPLVKRSRHRPFTAVTRVRFSHGSLYPIYILWLSGTVG